MTNSRRHTNGVRGLLFTILALAIMLSSVVCAQQTDRNEETANISSARTVELVSVDVTVRTSDRQLFVPVCGKQMADEFLCFGSATAMVEVETRQGWTPIKSRPDIMVGYYSPTGSVDRLIPPRTQARFTLEFSKRSYAIDQGQRARLVIMAWPDRETMVKNWQNTDHTIRIVTSEFQLP